MLRNSRSPASRDAALWHDALRDAGERELRSILADEATPAALLHGPAAARLATRPSGSARKSASL